jgi:hypothetical protein
MGKPAPIKAGNKADTSARTAPAKTEKDNFQRTSKTVLQLKRVFQQPVKRYPHKTRENHKIKLAR